MLFRSLVGHYPYENVWGLLVDDDLGDRREALEDVGVEVETLGEPAVVVDPGPRRVDVIYRARLVNGLDPDTVRPTSVEILEARWFPADELPELQHETAGALVALARTRYPINPTGEQES